MTRISSNTERRLIEAGKAVLFEKGFSGLTLRMVAQRAKVNLGMFAYHFKDKEDFMRQVAQEAYEEFYGSLTLGAKDQKDPVLALREALAAGTRFVRDHRQTVLVLARDLNVGHPEALRFARKNVPRHVLFLFGLIRRCRKQGRFKPMPMANLFAFIAGSIVAPSIMLGVVENVAAHIPLVKPALGLARRDALSDQAIEQRLDLMFAAVLKEAKP